MSQVNNIRGIGQVRPIAPTQKKYQQDAPKPGVTYSQVYRSGEPEETIQAILHFAKEKIKDKQEGKGGKKKKKQTQKKKKEKPSKQFDPDKTYMIASPMQETMVQPRKNGCAPTCLAMLLRKYGLVRSVREGYQTVEANRTESMQHLNDTGMSLEDISNHAQRCGLKARVQRGYSFLFQLEGLLRSLNRGATPIASVQLPGMGNMRHAVLIVGVTQHTVTIVDPARAEIQEITLEMFQQEWGKEDIRQAGVGLSYVEVWGENARGEVIHQVGWDTVLEELTRDAMAFSEIAQQMRDHPTFAPVVHFFPE